MAVKQEKIILYKNRGETPLECILRFKKENPDYMNDKMTYAGRLDPLAEGLLLVLVGDECKNKEKYLKFDKEYEVDVLFGFATDSYDLLGDVVRYNKDKCLKGADCLEYSDIKILQNITKIIKTFIGKINQKYPTYSSKNIKKLKRKNGGLTLKSEAGEGESSVFSVEEHFKEVEIKDIKILGSKTISKDFLRDYIKSSVESVKGDFRQNKILNKWEDVLNKTEQDNFIVISIKVECTSGTYMRSLANSIGEKIGIPALALNIKRIKVGDFKI